MPTKPKKPLPELPAIPKELIDQFVTGPMTAEAVNAASLAFKKALIERALGAELRIVDFPVPLCPHMSVNRVPNGIVSFLNFRNL